MTDPLYAFMVTSNEPDDLWTVSVRITPRDLEPINLSKNFTSLRGAVQETMSLITSHQLTGEIDETCVELVNLDDLLKQLSLFD